MARLAQRKAGFCLPQHDNNHAHHTTSRHPRTPKTKIDTEAKKKKKKKGWGWGGGANPLFRRRGGGGRGVGVEGGGARRRGACMRGVGGGGVERGGGGGREGGGGFALRTPAFPEIPRRTMFDGHQPAGSPTPHPSRAPPTPPQQPCACRPHQLPRPPDSPLSSPLHHHPEGEFKYCCFFCFVFFCFFFLGPLWWVRGGGERIKTGGGVYEGLAAL